MSTPTTPPATPPATPAAAPAPAQPAPTRSKKATNRELLEQLLAAKPAPTARPGFDSIPGFEALQRIATGLAASGIVPEAFRGRPGSEGHANCMVAVEMADRLGFPPLLVMQNVSVIDGKVGWQAQFYIALVNQSGHFEPLRWEKKGTPYEDDYGVRVVTKRKADGELCEGEWVTVRMAKKEGWWSKTGKSGSEYSKWQSMPDQMFVYRAASFWTRKWFPEGTLGLRSADELEDLAHEEKPALVGPPPARPAEAPPTPAPAADDQTLAPGKDPPSMATPLPENQLSALQEALAAKDWKRAQGEIAKLPRDIRDAGVDLYNQARRPE